MRQQPHFGRRKVLQQVAARNERVDLRRELGGVAQVLEDKAQKFVIIKADQDASYGDVMDAMDSLRTAGIEDMGLITDPKRGPAAGGGR